MTVWGSWRVTARELGVTIEVEKMADFYISSSPTPIGDPDERERMPLVSVDVVYDFYFRLPTSDFRLPTSAPPCFP